MGILKCDSSSQPRTNCGMAQYKMNGSNRFTWLTMKMHVRCGSNPGDIFAFTLAPEKKAILVHKSRCNQSCFRGSRTTASPINIGTAIKKCSQLADHNKMLRKTSQALFIRKRPWLRARFPEPGNPR